MVTPPGYGEQCGVRGASSMQALIIHCYTICHSPSDLYLLTAQARPQPGVGGVAAGLGVLGRGQP